jgi:hypothetical protein
MNITIEIKAPEIAKAIESLAAALSGKSVASFIPSEGKGAEVAKAAQHEISQQQAAAAQYMPQQANVVPFQQHQPPVQQQVPVQQPQTVPIAQHQAPPMQPQQPIQQQAPVQQPPQSVPTGGAPSYTMDQLAVAATQLMDAGRQQDLLALLASYGASSLMALPKEQYGAFATQLRGMGAKL